MPSREELRQFASGKQEIRQGPSQQATRFSGPGGCNGPQECDKFCRSNPDECLRWCDENPDVCPKEKLESPRQASTQVGSESQGFGSSSQGGKCPDGICDEFEKSNPAACPQDCGGSATKQPISIAQPSSAQACVGCLNNGICDIGECSECIDCLKGTRSITGEIIRAGGWNE